MSARYISMRVVFVLALALCICQSAISYSADAPKPLLKQGQPLDWWFVFKLNSAAGPACAAGARRACIFGGQPEPYKVFGQQFVYASSENLALQDGVGCAGDTVADPIGATYEQVYNGSLFYVVWNDQFYDDPEIKGCSKSCGSPWGHSKGMAAWNEDGEGVVIQVSMTDISNRQLVNNGGPSDIKLLVSKVGQKSDSKTYTMARLSTGLELISKPSQLHVPPWQLTSVALEGVSLRAATWWANPRIYTTTASSEFTCWDDALGDPGPVAIATSGQWKGKTFGLVGGSGPNFNHAKIGVSTSGPYFYSIYGGMNQQQGMLSGDNCGSSQNGRGGLFYVFDNERAHRSLGELIKATLRQRDLRGSIAIGIAMEGTQIIVP